MICWVVGLIAFCVNFKAASAEDITTTTVVDSEKGGDYDCTQISKYTGDTGWINAEHEPTMYFYDSGVSSDWYEGQPIKYRIHYNKLYKNHDACLADFGWGDFSSVDCGESVFFERDESAESVGELMYTWTCDIVSPGAGVGFQMELEFGFWELATSQWWFDESPLEQTERLQEVMQTVAEYHLWNVQLMCEPYEDNPPYLCSKTEKKYTFSDSISLSYANAGFVFTIVTSLLMYALYLIGGQKYADNQMPADSGHASDRDVEIEELSRGEEKSDEVSPAFASLKAEIEDIKALLKSDQEKKDHEKDADISASGREPEPGLLCTNF